jgi:hypothetical protein
MFRTMRTAFAILTVVAVALLVARASRAQHDDAPHAEQFLKCAKECARCQLECDSCQAHCVRMLKEGKKDHAPTVGTCADCAEACKFCATLCARSGPFVAHALECCIKCCDECGKACEKFPHDKHMAECAKACRECAKVCREMTKHSAHGK